MIYFVLTYGKLAAVCSGWCSTHTNPALFVITMRSTSSDKSVISVLFIALTGIVLPLQIQFGN